MPRRAATPKKNKKKTATRKTGGRAKATSKTVSRAKTMKKAAKASQRAKASRPKRIETNETPEQRKARARRILQVLRKLYPGATCALHHNSAYELLVATILSAQCTDERVNMVTPALFARYPDVRALANAKQDELEELIRSTGFYRNKAKNLIAMAKMAVEKFGGRIPDSMDALLELPGVARKTANCVLGTWYGRNVGIVVDTHVGRLAQRLGLLETARDDKDAVRIEQDLMKIFPRASWTFVAHALIWHGRKVCTARNPRCDECALAPHCRSAGRF